MPNPGCLKANKTGHRRKDRGWRPPRTMRSSGPGPGELEGPRDLFWIWFSDISTHPLITRWGFDFGPGLLSVSRCHENFKHGGPNICHWRAVESIRKQTTYLLKMCFKGWFHFEWIPRLQHRTLGTRFSLSGQHIVVADSQVNKQC